MKPFCPTGAAVVVCHRRRTDATKPGRAETERSPRPSAWDRVRRHVDRTPEVRFLLTGSATPSDASIHSGAGRILSIRMRPMSLAERGLTTPAVVLSDLLDSKLITFSAHTDLAAADYAEEILASGFPGIRGSTPQ